MKSGRNAWIILNTWRQNINLYFVRISMPIYTLISIGLTKYDLIAAQLTEPTHISPALSSK